MRDYDPTTGRYIQADPLGLVDGASVYGYALQNPGRYVDPRGQHVCAVTIIGSVACHLPRRRPAAPQICGPGVGTDPDDFIDSLPQIVNNEGPQTGNSELDDVLAGSTSGDGGNKGWETEGTKEELEEALGNIEGAEQSPLPGGGSTTNLPDGTKVDVYPGRTSTGLPGWSVTPPGGRYGSGGKGSLTGR